MAFSNTITWPARTVVLSADVTATLATYELPATATAAGSIAQAAAAVDGNLSGIAKIALPDNAGLPGAAARGMSLGSVFLGQGPDGSLRNYVMDAERSTSAKIVLRPL